MGEAAPPSRPLTSWKEIADLFGRDVRTVQRWEKDERMPVHRHPHQRRASVYAYRDELDAWWKRRAADEPSGNPGPPPSSPTAPRLRRLMGLVAVVMVAATTSWPGQARSAGVTARVVMAASPLPLPMEAFAVGDLNADGVDDVAAIAVNSATLNVWLGAGEAQTLTRLPSVTVSGPANTFMAAPRLVDFDRDGAADLLVTARLHEPDSFRASSPVYLVRGRRDWPARLQLPEDADLEVTVTADNEVNPAACFPLDRPIDLNADGWFDIALGAVDYIADGRASAGAIFVLFGRPSWPRTIRLPADADVTLIGSRMGEGLGAECLAGQLDRDGRPDLVALAHETTLWNLLGGRGRFYGISGRAEWPPVLDMARDASFVIAGAGGSSVTSPPTTGRTADIDGDGADDLILGWPRGGQVTDDRGELTVFLGGNRLAGHRAPGEADIIISGGRAGAYLGAAIVAEDFDADGIDDLVLAEGGARRLWLAYGRRQWPALAGLEALGALRWQPELRVLDARLLLARRGRNVPLVWLLDGWFDQPPMRLARIELAEPVSVDVRPDWTPNVVLVPGPVVVRILDVADDPIDLRTLRMAGVTPERVARRDEDADGREEIYAYFETAKLALAPDASRVDVHARTRSGRPVTGGDDVTVVRRQAPESMTGHRQR